MAAHQGTGNITQDISERVVLAQGCLIGQLAGWVKKDFHDM